MEQQMSVTKNFRGDSYGNLDLENPAKEVSTANTKSLESEKQTNLQGNSVESELDKSQISALHLNNNNNTFEAENSSRNSENGIEQKNQIKNEETEEVSTTLQKDSISDDEDGQSVKDTVPQTDKDQSFHDEIYHADDEQDQSQIEEKHQANNFTSNSLPQNEITRTPRDRLSVHITKEHGSDNNYGDDDSGEDSGENEDLDDADIGRIFIEGNRIDSARSETRPQTTSTFREVPGGLRAKANTPASLYTNPNELDSQKDLKMPDSNRGVSRETREEVFRRAMTLMSNRCTSARGQDDELFADRELPFGLHVPQYFYVQQSKPQPMAPLKAWRGYKGNVYFEPISIQSVITNTQPPCLSRESSPSKQKRQSTPAAAPSTQAPTRATTAAQSTRSYRFINSSSQVFIMDKQAIVNNFNDSMPRELNVIEKTESTGSLAMRPLSSGATLQSYRPVRDRKLLYKREKICRGSNVHPTQSTKNSADSTANSRKPSLGNPRGGNRKQLSYSAGANRKPGSHKVNPNLIVSGDKFAPPTVMSPLLRTTTQFSLSSQRIMLNTPDLLGAYEKLPPLEQLQVSIQHINTQSEDNSRTTPFSSPRYTEELKPFIKYSPEVRANYEGNNMPYC